ncbi:MAG: transposase [Selenomonadaceae bacterium]|nr:transposase [Selenomonadaceae bacterium]
MDYEKSERSDSDNARKGHKSKRVNSGYDNFSVEVPQDRKSTFAPQILPKRQKDISGIDRKIISMYGRGLSTCQISDTIEELYGFEVSDSFVSDVTDNILQQIHEWQSRPLEEVYTVQGSFGH